MKTNSFLRKAILICTLLNSFHVISFAAKRHSSPQLSDQQLLANLYIVSGSNEALADGMRIRNNTNYLTATTDDVIKMMNPGENICSYRENKSLIIERRPWIVQHDTIFLRLTNLQPRSYRIKFYTISFSQSNMIGWVEDSYSGKTTSLSLNGDTSRLDFDVTASPESSAPDRFRVIFSTTNALPVTFTSINAVQQTGGNLISWNVGNQLNISGYDVERSADGINFKTLTLLPTHISNGTDISYQWLDANPLQGNNYYRIRGTGISGDIKYSSIVHINGKASLGKLAVYSNPVIGSTMQVTINVAQKGDYQLRVSNSEGQIIKIDQVNLYAGNTTIAINLPLIPPGIYVMDLVGADVKPVRFVKD